MHRDYQLVVYIFFFNDTATTEIYTLSLHDALPISKRLHLAPLLRGGGQEFGLRGGTQNVPGIVGLGAACEKSIAVMARSEEHTSELQSRQYLVCRLLLEKKKKH